MNSKELMEAHMVEVRQRHASAIKRFWHHYEPSGLAGAPHFKAGHQGFALDYTHVEGNDALHREWLGIMLCAALERLVAEHSESALTQARAEGSS
ncbi:hypothetical protein GCM10007385_35090 [Tateyamaria omphalii]|uniref:hypothetical protein n=1 Tax=Tateyamaria omphalii TaxID=299262 RepID=UPI0016722E30|nr:hypothetical protein [Tateyamaria omphalii]GGX62944.1 hypothetical protein GCM10007385_35090 [Tateyamaria omphalii]